MIETMIKYFFQFLPVILMGAAFIAVLINNKEGLSLKENIGKQTLRYVVGGNGIFAGTSHIFFQNVAAKSIGWECKQKGKNHLNGFQYEMGVTNYAIATAGILASTDKYYNTDYRIAVVTFVSIVYLGCALNHIREAVLHKNFNVQNIGPSFINDVVTPIVLLLTLD